MTVGADLASVAGKCCRDARHHLRRGSTSSTTGTTVLPTLLAEDRAASERELPDRNVPARPLPTASSSASNDNLYSALATARPLALSRCDSSERACWSLPKQAVFKVAGSIGDSTVRLWKERLYLSGCLAVSSVSCARAADTGPSPLYTREHRHKSDRSKGRTQRWASMVRRSCLLVQHLTLGAQRSTSRAQVILGHEGIAQPGSCPSRCIVTFLDGVPHHQVVHVKRSVNRTGWSKTTVDTLQPSPTRRWDIPEDNPCRTRHIVTTSARCGGGDQHRALAVAGGELRQCLCGVTWGGCAGYCGHRRSKQSFVQAPQSSVPPVVVTTITNHILKEVV